MRLTEKQLKQVVAEVSRLEAERADLRQNTLERADVERIVKDLGLSPDLIDDALARIELRNALARRTRSHQRLLALVCAGMLLLAGGIGAAWYWKSSRLAGVSAQRAYISLGETGQSAIPAVKLANPGETVEVFHQIVLQHLPQGSPLTLTSRWIDPNGTVYQEKTYQTKPIDRPVWTTHARCRIGPNPPTGTWKVELILAGRVIETTTFQVEVGHITAPPTAGQTRNGDERLSAICDLRFAILAVVSCPFFLA